MTALAAMLTPTDRERLLERLRELRALDREMRRPGSLAAPDEPVTRFPPPPGPGQAIEHADALDWPPARGLIHPEGARP